MKIGVVIFPGSNCDRDIITILDKVNSSKTIKIWHKDSKLPDLDMVFLPGGFSYGDYLRSGAIAAHSPIMQEIVKFANKGGYVVGICNGFQILTESDLLEGTLLRNKNLKFICQDQNLNVASKSSIFTNNFNIGDVLNFPIAHHDGNYFNTHDGLKKLQDEDSIIFQYCTQNGEINENCNPNGSISNIAGITNKNKNVLGLMPHPERHSDLVNGNDDGLKFFQNLISNL